MTDNKFADTYIHQVGRFCYVAHTPATVIVGVGESRDEAKKIFKSNWGNRGEINWIDSPPPPPPKKDNDRAPIAEVIEASEEHRRGHSVYRRLLAEFHPDKNPDAIYSAADMTRVVLELWQATK